MMLVPCWLLIGCHHAGTVPPGWLAQPYHAEADPDDGRLQVFICYGQVLSNHSALRLVTPERPTLMWDPGGTYEHDDPAYGREHDVLTRGDVSVDQWWHYRKDICREPVVEMYEWRLPDKQARRLYAILTTRHDPLDPSQTFEPDALGLGCSLRVSTFLDRFADGRPAVQAHYFWPHELGEHLWAQSPDRVVIFRSGGPTLAYIPEHQTPTGSGR